MARTAAITTLLFLLCGCSVLQTAIMSAIAPNPEVIRQKQETERQKDANASIVKADTPEKVKALKDVHENVSKGSHAGFWSNVVSMFYTEQGRWLAGSVVTALAFMGLFIWRLVVSYMTGQSLIGTLMGNIKLQKKHPELKEDMEAIWAKEHSKIPVNVNKYVKAARRRLAEREQIV